MTVGNFSIFYTKHRIKITKKGNFNYVIRSGDRGKKYFLIPKNPKNSKKILKIIKKIPTALESL
jgi:hypothetical protein